MRTLIAFGICCAALLAALVWMVGPAVVPASNDSHLVAVVPNCESTMPPFDEFASSGRAASGTPEFDTPFIPHVPSPSDPPTEAERLGAAPSSEPAVARTRGTLNPAGTRKHDELKRRLSAALDAIVRDPQNVVALDDALDAAASLEDEDRIADLLGRKLRITPDDQTVRFRYAAALMRLRQWVLALPELRTLAAATPSDQRVWHNLALTLHALGSLTDAREAWGNLLRIAPQDLDARARRAELSLDLGDWRSAADDLAIVLAADPSATDVALNLALARLKLRDFEAARAAVRPLLAIDGLKASAEKRLAAIDAAELDASAPSRDAQP